MFEVGAQLLQFWPCNSYFTLNLNSFEQSLTQPHLNLSYPSASITQQHSIGFTFYHSTQVQDYNRLQFFMEDQVYWAPASTTSGLYAQLASKKYREIHRSQLRYSCKKLFRGHRPKPVLLMPGFWRSWDRVSLGRYARLFGLWGTRLQSWL